jgi:hypothetical protein
MFIQPQPVSGDTELFIQFLSPLQYSVPHIDMRLAGSVEASVPAGGGLTRRADRRPTKTWHLNASSSFGDLWHQPPCFLSSF